MTINELSTHENSPSDSTSSALNYGTSNPKKKFGYPLAKNILLTGMPGCGKSTIGRDLSFRFGLGYIDLDDFILKKFDIKSVFHFIKAQGEAAYRGLEKTALMSFCDIKNHVIALGGGTQVASPELAKLCEEMGTLVWLQSPMNIIADRITKDAYELNRLRPLLFDEEDLKLSKNEFKEKILAKLNEIEKVRAPLYGKSKVCIQTGFGLSWDLSKQIYFELFKDLKG